MNTLFLLAVESEAIMKALEIMWKGVVAIFLVIALIIIVTNVVNKLCVRADIKRANKEKEEKEQGNSNS